MSTASLPANFNWVEERSKCSPYKVFLELRAGVKADVESRNKARETEKMKWDVTGKSDDFFTVFREDGYPNSQGATVDFSLKNDEILVSDASRVLFTASITLNNEGQCRLLVNGEELEQWQVRRKALEAIFFGPFRAKYVS